MFKDEKIKKNKKTGQRGHLNGIKLHHVTHFGADPSDEANEKALKYTKDTS